MCGSCQYFVWYLNSIGVNKQNIRDFVESSVNNVHKLEATGRDCLTFCHNGNKYSNMSAISGNTQAIIIAVTDTTYVWS